MEPCGSRFTPAEGGARLVNASRGKNLIVADHTTFIALRLLHEEAYNIRGSLTDGKKRSVYITRASRVECTAYDVNLLTDLSVVSAIKYDDVLDWLAELDKKEVVVCTSVVIRRVIEEGLLSMANINVIIIDSCHLVCKDGDLRFIMHLYKTASHNEKPRVLALTYPLFGPKVEEPPTDTENETNQPGNENENTTNDNDTSNNDIDKQKNELDGSINVEIGKSDTKPVITESLNENNTNTISNKTENNTVNKEIQKTNTDGDIPENYSKETKSGIGNNKSDIDNLKNENDKANNPDLCIGAYENLDDFDMYEKLEWKIDVLENELCCEADLAEDIDGIKRLSPAITKPREVIVEFSEQKIRSLLPSSYVDVENYMRTCIEDVLLFFQDHRYEPMEIYGEDLYEELIKIPNPTIDPNRILYQFLYVLDQLGPYAADKAAFALLAKLEKLRIKVPYERHFLLLCICTTVFVKIRCYADLVFSEFENDWEKIQRFSTPKLLRFVEILEKFKPPDYKIKSENDNSNIKSEIDTDNKDQSDTLMTKSEMLKAVESCDFATLGNKIEDKINAYDADLKEITDFNIVCNAEINQDQKISSIIPKLTDSITSLSENDIDKFKNNQSNKEEDTNSNKNDTNRNNDNINHSETNATDTNKNYSNSQKIALIGFPKRHGHRVRGRGRLLRTHAMKSQQSQQNPDALCGIVFIKEPFMAKILFNLVVDLSRSHPSLGFLSAQYSAIEKLADPVKEPRDFETQRKNQEDVLKKFRMHECNLLLATSVLEEGIDLPRCNLVLRWDVPSCYRSHGLCRSRARAPRAACVLLSHARGDNTASLVQNVATYTQIDQIITKKCGCGIQNEPDQLEEEFADLFTPCIQAYTTQSSVKREKDKNKSDTDITKSENDVTKSENDTTKIENDTTKSENDTTKSENDIKNSTDTNKECMSVKTHYDNKTVHFDNVNEIISTVNNNKETENVNDIASDKSDTKLVKSESDNIISENDKTVIESETSGACVDLGSAIALINRYCGKLPSDTFTRLAPQWWMEKVSLPRRDNPNEMKEAYVCSLRLPLNCPVKFNIVGHPMPTRVLARRMAALQAARILHKSGELDHNLMPISKENFQSVELDIGASPKYQARDNSDPNDIARPGTTKRRQYYYKKTAKAFTNCEPVINATDEEILKPFNPSMLTDSAAAGGNRLCAVWCSLACALPERYNTRGRTLHAPQHAAPALALLLADTHAHRMQIPQFPVYTRSGEVRVSLKHVPDADTRLSPHRQSRILRFMRFVFSEVLRVRRKGMRLDPTACTHNNYYVVPTIKTTKADGSPKIDIDWDFLEVIYNYTEDRLKKNIGKASYWQDEDDYDDGEDNSDNVKNENDIKCQNDNKSEIDTNKLDGGKESDIDVSNKITEVEMMGEKSIAEVQKCDMATKEIDVDNTSQDQNKQKLESNEQVIDSQMNQNSIQKSENEDTKTQSEIVKTQNDNLKTQSDNLKTQKDNLKNLNENLKTQNEILNSRSENDKLSSGRNKKVAKKMENPFLKPGEVFVFDPEKYKEAVVTPWYRNQDQPQFFLVAEICWNLTPDSAFPSDTHTTFRSYYQSKYGVELTQPNQPLLDVDHTSARLNLLTPRYVNRKGVALPVSSERTRRAKRDRLDQKQILLPELCHTHPFPAPLWFATVALPAILYRLNALLIADEIREIVAIEASLGVPKVTDPDFQWPPLHFGWSLEEVLNADSEKHERVERENEERKKDENSDIITGNEKTESTEKETETEQETKKEECAKEKTINDILQEKEFAESGFEIGMWSNEMASAIPEVTEYEEFMEPLPPNLTFCTSASGGADWCNLGEPKKTNYTPGKTFSMADSDCSYISSDFDTDDSDLNSGQSDDETESSGFGSTRYTNAMGVRIEYKTAHEAEAVDLENKTEVNLGPKPCERDDHIDRCEQEAYLREGCVPEEYKQKYHTAVEKHKKEITANCIVPQNEDITYVLPPSPTHSQKNTQKQSHDKKALLDQLFPYGTRNTENLLTTDEITLEALEMNKKILMAEIKNSLPESEVKKMNCFSMIDVDIDAAGKQNKDYIHKAELRTEESIKDEISINKHGSFESNRIEKEKDSANDFKPYYQDDCGLNGKTFDFDYQPNLEGHPGPSPSLILQALTMSNANDGINLERLETIGDSFLKLAITTRLYCAHPTVHEGKLSHMRSKQVSNLNLYRLGRNKNLGTLMIASKFEPHDNWLPPCHKAPKAADFTSQVDSQDKVNKNGACASNDGCFIPYNLITQHSIPDKSIADCVEALIGAYLLACGPRGALLFMCWLGLTVLPKLPDEKSPPQKSTENNIKKEKQARSHNSDSECGSDLSDNEARDGNDLGGNCAQIKRPTYGELKPPPSPLLRYIADPEGELERMLSGYEVLEETLQYRFRDRSLLLQAMTHASHQTNRLTDCYQRLEFLGDAILDYLITRHLFVDARRHSPGALTDLRSALVNNTIFATLAVRHRFHKFFRHMSPGLNEVLTKYVKIQEENGHSISEEHYLIQEDEMEQAEDVEVPKALGDLFESVAGAIFLDSGMSLSAVWRSYERLMRLELEAFSAAAPKSPVRELLEQEPDTAKFGKPERLADGRRVRVKVEVFGRGTFKGIGRNYRIAKGTAARCALRHLKTYNNR